MASLVSEAPPREEEKPRPGAQRIEDALFSGLRELERDARDVEIDARLTVSDRELLQKKDFAQMSAAEIAAAKAAIKRLVLSLDEIKTRRLAPHPRGHIVDMRRTLRAQPQGRRRADRPEVPRADARASRRSSRCSISPAR